MAEDVVKVFPKSAPEWDSRPEPESRFRLEAFDTIEPGRTPWRVKGLWPAVGVCFIGGPSMSGKSFWTLDALARVRRGLPVIGRKSVPAGVVYVAAEGAAGVRKRIAGLRSEIGPLGGGFDFIGQAPNLTDAEDVEALAAVLRKTKEAQAAIGAALGAVCIDTLSAAIPGADENNAKDMSPVLTALQALAAELGVVVLIVAHTGKDETRGLRGWSGLLANADGLVMLSAPTEDGRRSGKVEKVKDGEAGDTFGFELRQVELGHDEDGDPITTCVVDHTDAPVGPSHPRTRLSPKQELVLRCVRLCVDERDGVGPMPNGPGIKPGTEGVQRATVKARAMREGYADGDIKADSARRKLNEHLADLIGRGHLRGQGDYVCLV